MYVKYKSKNKSYSGKTHKIRAPTHNVFMDSISLSGGKGDPLPVKSLILLQASLNREHAVNKHIIYT
jgi:hypothetical protein